MVFRASFVALCVIAVDVLASGCARPSDGARLSGAPPDLELRAKADHAQPDPSYTPGTLCKDTDAYFDGYRYKEQVPHCQRHVTKEMKLTISANYGLDEADWSSYEFDHYLPLGIGGSTDVDNLWPEPKDEAAGKDKLENDLYREMDAGTITQEDAVRQIRDWQLRVR
jgi:hypothetical protein